MKSLMNRSELLLHVTIASQGRSQTNTPAGTPGPGSICMSLLLDTRERAALILFYSIPFPQHLNLYQMPSL